MDHARRSLVLDALVPGVAIGFMALVALALAGTLLQGSKAVEGMHLDAIPIALSVPALPCYGYVRARQLAIRAREEVHAGLSVALGLGAFALGILAHAGGLLAMAIANATPEAPGGPRLVQPIQFVAGTELDAQHLALVAAEWAVVVMAPLAAVAAGVSRWALRPSSTS